LWALLLSLEAGLGFQRHSEWRYVVRYEIFGYEGFRAVAVYYFVSIRDMYISAYVCS